MKSCKQLAEVLRNTELKPNITDKEVREYCETFGRKVFAYIDFGDIKNRARAERLLREHGFKPSAGYWPGSGTSEIPVSYFKAWHWDE